MGCVNILKDMLVYSNIKMLDDVVLLDRNKLSRELKKKFNLLGNFVYVENIEDISLGSLIRYVSILDDSRVKYGGILLKIINRDLLMKTANNKLVKLNFDRNMIFALIINESKRSAMERILKKYS
jgi:hypothetical protein